MSLLAGGLFADSRTAMMAHFRFRGGCWYLTQAHEAGSHLARASGVDSAGRPVR
jgi:hypothetical protein